MYKRLPIGLFTLVPAVVEAADAPNETTNTVAIFCFLAVIGITVVITYRAAGRTRSASEFYVAGGQISGTQNGIALAGDFMSAATMLGITAIIFGSGFDGIIYLIAPSVAFAMMALLMTDRLRAMGRYSFSDVVSARLRAPPMRVLAASATLVSAIMYLVLQMVGAGALVQVLFGIDYKLAVILVGALMVIYVAFGGMLATTWVQITKALMLVSGILVLAFLSLLAFGFDLEALYAQALARHPKGELFVRPGGLDLGFWGALSLICGLIFGLVGSPHILMRFFTVPDARSARQSALVAMILVAVVNLLILVIIAPAAIALVTGNAQYLDETGAVLGGANMVSIHLSEIVGGSVFLGVMSAVAFATILAVVAGLTLASASAVSHDLWANVIRRNQAGEGEEVLVSRIATGFIGGLAIVLGIAFEGQNIAYLVALALTVAASANFPLLIYSMYWRGLTTRGALVGGWLGLLSAVSFVVLGPAVWVNVLGFAEPVFPVSYPALYSIVIAFACIWLFSRFDRSAEGQKDRERAREYLGQF
ncbi:MAG: cation acetate symporter [Gammaproteobacteria bacterium]|nr:cation acetate symporter [Gammaproteobacteria bacterium]